MDIKLIFGITTLHFLALISPGPDFVLALRNSLQFGRKMGLATALGFGLGIAIHVGYSVAGIAILLKEFPRVYHFIRYAGALYLIWLGLSSLWEARKAQQRQGLEIKARPKQGFWQCLRQGFLTNILNPKATLFILGIYTSLIPADASLLTLVVAGINMVALTIIWFSLVSWLFSSMRIRDGYSKIERGLNLLFSVFFILVGVTLFL
jgi:RhtB (resistance to homoserine/threonine) family protein